jgi:hypothetical protein
VDGRRLGFLRRQKAVESRIDAGGAGFQKLLKLKGFAGADGTLLFDGHARLLLGNGLIRRKFESKFNVASARVTGIFSRSFLEKI